MKEKSKDSECNYDCEEGIPEISVIVPVYMVEDYLDDCIHSILAQNFDNFELILIDDGTRDSCGEMCDAYSEIDDRIIVIHQKNKGLSAARNQGLEVASGRYITFVDSDDIISPFYLEALHNIMEKEAAEVVVCDLKIFTNSEEFSFGRDDANCDYNTCRISGKEAAALVYDNSHDRLSVAACGKLYKKELFEGIRFPENRINEDVAVVPILLYAVGRVCWLRRQLYGYRDRQSSIMHAPFSLKRYDFLTALDKCITFFEDKGEYQTAFLYSKEKGIQKAQYSLQARKAGLYQRVPRRYKMSIWGALYYLRTNLPYDLYEYRLYPICPHFITIEAYVRRIIKSFGYNKNDYPS